MRCRCSHDAHAPGKCPSCACQRDDRPYKDPGPTTPAWVTPPVELCMREECGHPEGVHTDDGPDTVCSTCYAMDLDTAYHRFRRYDPE